MATRSTISLLQPDGKSVKTIYCHSDGYLSHNGAILLKHYNTIEKVEALIALGDLSYLDEHLNPLPEAPMRRYYAEGKPPLISTHSFDQPQDGVTIAYGRDRGENNTEATEYPTFKDAQKEGYDYLFKNGCWYVQGYNNNRLKKLTENNTNKD